MAAPLSRVTDERGQTERSDLSEARLLHLAYALTGLLASTNEYCTPGHRMGFTFRLMLNAHGDVLAYPTWPTLAHAEIRRPA